jgi:hypothetical protein
MSRGRPQYACVTIPRWQSVEPPLHGDSLRFQEVVRQHGVETR